MSSTHGILFDIFTYLIAIPGQDDCFLEQQTQGFVQHFTQADVQELGVRFMILRIVCLQAMGHQHEN